MSDLQGGLRTVEADRIVIATGTTPAHPPGVEFDEGTILDSDGILLLSRIPSTLVVVGAGVIGIEYASIFAALGTRVTVVEKRERLLEFCDNQMVEALQYHLRDLGVVFRLGETVTSVEKHDGGTLTDARERQADRRRRGHVLRRPAGRDRRSRPRGGRHRGRRRAAASRSTSTTAPRSTHIYAVGDVIGFPSLASTSMEQGRLAACARLRPRRAADAPTCCRSASTRSPRSATSAAPRRS